MKWIIFTQALLAFATSSARSLYLETFHSGIWKVPEDTDNTLNISLRFNASSEIGPDLETLHDLGALLVVTVIPDEDWKLYFVNTSVVFTAQEVRDEVVKNITFSGYYWGLTRLSFYLTRNDLDSDFKNRVLLRDDLQVVIDRRSKVVDNIFIAVASVFVLFNNINMGAQLDIKLIWGVLKKPVGPICGLLSQFICMPTVTWIMGSLLFADTLQRLGLFTYGCCPGGTSSNFWTLMFNGDLNLSITMTTVSFVAAMGMMPLWMFTLGSGLMDGEDTIVIPFSNLAISLLALSLPICIGIIVRLKRPAWADKGKKILKPCILFVLIFFLTVGMYNSYKVFMLMNWKMILAGVLVVITGYTFGALFAKVMCLERPQVIAVSIETAMQNTGVATILLKLSLESPFSDLASIPIFATFFVTGPPLFIVYFFYKMMKRLRNRFGFGDAEKDTPVERPDSPETASFLPGDEGTAKDQETMDDCSKREANEDGICSINEENKDTICTIRQENEDGICSINEENKDTICPIRQENEDGICSINGENKDPICTIRQENEDDICSIKEENKDTICTLRQENEDGICSIKEENKDTICTIRQENEDGICSINEENKDTICTLRQENEDGICSINEENKDTICTIRQENEDSICSIKEENKDTICTLRQENEDGICSINEENKDTICTIRQENEDSICSIKEENKDTICTIRQENEDGICSINEENKDAICTIRQENEDGICSINEENKDTIYTIGEENEGTCNIKEENRDATSSLIEGNEDTVYIKEENKGTICTIREENENSICSMTGENRDAICSLQEESEDTICSIAEENNDAAYTIREEKEDSICSMKEESRDTISSLKEENEGSICSTKEKNEDAEKDENVDDSDNIDKNMEENSSENDEHVEDDSR